MTLTFGVTVYIEIIILTECTSYNRTEYYAEEHTDKRNLEQKRERGRNFESVEFI